eukprot:m.975360 g.975360  ORF g.975360 m.975360 type:complete len:548 (-) comp23939_c0_seq11:98-1741(-)
MLSKRHSRPTFPANGYRECDWSVIGHKHAARPVVCCCRDTHATNERAGTMAPKLLDWVVSRGICGVFVLTCALIAASRVWPSLLEERAVQWEFQSLVYRGSEEKLTCTALQTRSRGILKKAYHCHTESKQNNYFLLPTIAATAVQWPGLIDVNDMSNWHCDDAESVIPMIARVRVIGPYIKMLPLSRYCVPYAPPGEGHAIYMAEFHPSDACAGATFSLNVEPNFAEGAFHTDASRLDQFENACGNYLDAVRDYTFKVARTWKQGTGSVAAGSECGDSDPGEHWSVNTSVLPTPSLRASDWSPSQQSRESVSRFLTYTFRGNRRVMNHTCIQSQLDALVKKNESLCIMGDSHTRVLYYAALEHLLGVTKEQRKLHSDQVDTPPFANVWLGQYDGTKLAPVATCAKLYVSFAHWYMLKPGPVPHPLLPREFAGVVRDALRYLKGDYVPRHGKIFWGLAYAVRGYTLEYFKGFLTCPPNAFYNDAIVASYNRYSSSVARELGIPIVDGFSITQPVPELQKDTIHYSEPATGTMVHLVLSHMYPECFGAT